MCVSVRVFPVALSHEHRVHAVARGMTSWAAKEAAYKAFGRWRVQFPEMEVVTASAKQPPQLRFHGGAAELCEDQCIVVRPSMRQRVPRWRWCRLTSVYDAVVPGFAHFYFA